MEIDAIVLTQACDLENKKVRDVILCPHYDLDELKISWEGRQAAIGQSASAKAWAAFCKRICDGALWNYAMLNEGGADGLTTRHRVVDFHEVYTLPRSFVESVLGQQGPRLRLCPPYREHLSQAFARYFMRVGLPESITQRW